MWWKFRFRTWHFVIVLVLFPILTHIIDHKNIIQIPYENKIQLSELNNKGDFNNKLSTKVSFVLFTDKKSVICRIMEANLIQTLLEAGNNSRVGFYKIEANESIGICNKYNVSAIPTILILEDGKEINRIMGKVSVSNLKLIYKRYD